MTGTMSDPTQAALAPDAQPHCCEPDCGPDTCGASAEEDPRFEDPPTAVEQCCEPGCDPSTCG